MATTHETSPPFHESQFRKEEVVIPQRPPTRSVKTPRTALRSARSRRGSIESKENKDLQNDMQRMTQSDFYSQNMAGTDTQLKSSFVSEKDFKEGVTLDKIFGGTYKKIEIFAPQSGSEDPFPAAPVLHRRSTLQENFEIKEIEEEDEENYETKKEFYKVLGRKDRGFGSMSLRTNYHTKSPRSIERSPVLHNDAPMNSETSMQIPRKTQMSFSEKMREDSFMDMQSKTSRTSRQGLERRAGKKTVYSQSKSPTQLPKTGQNFHQTKGIQFYKKMQVYPVSHGRSIEDIKAAFGEALKKEIMHKTIGNPFYNKGEKESTMRTNDFIVSNEAEKSGMQFDQIKVKSSREFEALSEKTINKKNKFLYQNAILQKKIKEEEKLLLSKYKTKFDINIPEGYGKQTVNPIAITYERKSEMIKKSYSPFLKDPMLGTFYKVGNQRGLLH